MWAILCQRRVSEQTHPRQKQSGSPGPPPKTSEDVRKFMRFAGFYRKFIKDFSKIARFKILLFQKPLGDTRNEEIHNITLIPCSKS